MMESRRTLQIWYTHKERELRCNMPACRMLFIRACFLTLHCWIFHILFALALSGADVADSVLHQEWNYLFTSCFWISLNHLSMCILLRAYRSLHLYWREMRLLIPKLLELSKVTSSKVLPWHFLITTSRCMPRKLKRYAQKVPSPWKQEIPFNPSWESTVNTTYVSPAFLRSLRDIWSTARVCESTDAALRGS